MLEGFVALAPGQALLEEETVVVRADTPADPAKRKVAVLSGGGSGHEPAHAGYVGEGMLDAAVAGDVLTSPGTAAVLAAIRALPESAWTSPAQALAAMGGALRRAIAGSSGPFHATALLRASRHLTGGAVDAAAWAGAFSAAVDAIAQLGGARPGGRTLLDAPRPAADTFLRALKAGQQPPSSG